MTASMLIKGGLLLFRSHPMAPFADAMLIRHDNLMPGVTWDPIVLVPPTESAGSCAYCGAAHGVVRHGTRFPFNATAVLSCRNLAHGVADPARSILTTMYHVQCKDLWRELRLRLNPRSRWRTFTYGPLGQPTWEEQLAPGQRLQTIVDLMVKPGDPNFLRQQFGLDVA
jgi:hypothetical protein